MYSPFAAVEITGIIVALLILVSVSASRLRQRRGPVARAVGATLPAAALVAAPDINAWLIPTIAGLTVVATLLYVRPLLGQTGWRRTFEGLRLSPTQALAATLAATAAAGTPRTPAAALAQFRQLNTGLGLRHVHAWTVGSAAAAMLLLATAQSLSISSAIALPASAALVALAIHTKRTAVNPDVAFLIAPLHAAAPTAPLDHAEMTRSAITWLEAGTPVVHATTTLEVAA